MLCNNTFRFLQFVFGRSGAYVNYLVQFRFKNEKEVEALFKNGKSRKAISDEIVDILHTVLRFAQKFDIDLTTELERKMKENEKKYPVK